MGKPCREEVVEFCERIYFKTGEVQDSETRWPIGTWLGKRWRSGEHFVHFQGEVIKCRAIHRVPLEERWNKDEVEEIAATPWETKPSP